MYPSGVPPFSRVPQCPFGEMGPLGDTGEVGAELDWLLIEPVVDDAYDALIDMFIDIE